ncbi:MAG: type I-E CRISPR-associated protein Cas5/CasD [Desulfobacteraceae bacterium]|nr:type I-E CRISPR-associated protein Cas5/CasD [Desulfobacteraceae bacterium]
MSTKLVVLRLSGVLQSWGYNSEYTYRNTGLFPTKSAVLGLCCAAKGLNRGSDEEHEFLEAVAGCPMTAVALPRTRTVGEKNWSVNVRRIEDFHTVQGALNAKGKQQVLKIDGRQQVRANGSKVLQCDVTYRQYLCDSDFLVVIEMDAKVADDLKDKLSDPDWGIWLGRKSCIPSAPIFAGIFQNIDAVSNELLQGKALDKFTCQHEVKDFEQGTDTLMDNPIDYAVDKRERSHRRVKICEAKR